MYKVKKNGTIFISLGENVNLTIKGLINLPLDQLATSEGFQRGSEPTIYLTVHS